MRRYHAQGRKVIATGRRAENLEKLKGELPGLVTYQVSTRELHRFPINRAQSPLLLSMYVIVYFTKIAQFDINDFARTETVVRQILAEHSGIDTVIIMSGIQSVPLFRDPSSTHAQKISTEISTNLTAPCVLAQSLVPHFAHIETPTNIVLVSSGLAFIPIPLFAVYNATKAGIHYFAMSLRGQLAEMPINVIELAPPYVDTGLDANHREMIRKITEDKGHPPMPLDEYMDAAIDRLDERIDGKPRKEVLVGFSEIGGGAFRKAFDPIFQQMGFGAL